MNAADLHGLLDGLLPALGEFAGKLILSALLLLIGIKLIGFVRSRSRKALSA